MEKPENGKAQEPREIWLEPTLEDLENLACLYIGPDCGPLSADIETGGGQINCISFLPSNIQSHIIPFVDYRQPSRSYWRSEEEELAAWSFVARILSRSPDQEAGSELWLV
jgi:hypothetical protein